MNTESNRRIEVARTDEEMYEKLEQFKLQGYAESDIHVISNDRNHMHTLNRHSEVSTHEAGTMMDKFKSWFTGEDSITEGLKKLDLNDAETERYSKDVASGGFVLYTDSVPISNEIVGSHQNEFEEGYDTFGATGNSYESYHGDTQPLQAVEPGFEDRHQMNSSNTFENSKQEEFTSTTGTEFVESRFNEIEFNEVKKEAQTNSTDSTTFGAQEPRNTSAFSGTNQEPQSEYAKEQGFTASNNEFVNQTEGRFDEPQDRFDRGESFATDPYMARETDHIGHSTQEDKMVQKHRPSITESITSEQLTDGYQSPGADPNLGPAPFGEESQTDFQSNEMKHDFEKDPRGFKTQVVREGYTDVSSDEDIVTDQYEESIDSDKYRGESPPSNRLF